ncbi:MAG TPA: FAD-dependent oxidoreductase [Stackebrandtia sp.]|uniref:FAD-dependent oxidoreductase n=1 Tax=Stackebrandtia sp. TaxID=2023065 RepID=UPI002D636C86|nr:FAD-dependent oxidoreductase [Stackebrandtia sp.]HZE37691.1 FAD-dependent oxidoreductase [Stackebrandtia sp.]
MERSYSAPARIAIIGGSIAGCAAATAARRAGHDVTVYERSQGELSERGFGIAIPGDLYEELLARAYIDTSMARRTASSGRLWLTRSPIDGGQLDLWRQPFDVVACNWGLLWASLREHVPDETYHSGQTVTAVRRFAEGTRLRLNDGRERDFDLVIGADGYRSVIRAELAPQAKPRYAGYILLRGTVPVDDVPDCAEAVDQLADTAVTIGFTGGHAVIYVIPGRDGVKVNWGVYACPPEAAKVGLSTSYAPDADLSALMPWMSDVIENQFPSAWARLIRRTPEAARAIQPVFDLAVPVTARMPYLLAGDANTITRPHTGSGATKALRDVLFLEDALRDSPSWQDALARYDEDRNAAGNSLVELGRRLGKDQVEATPDWASMNPEKMREWTQSTMAGQNLYLYQENAKQSDGAGRA